MGRNFFLAFLLVAALPCTAAYAAGHAVIVDGSRLAVVVLPEGDRVDQEGMPLLAALEIGRYVGKTTGRDLPVLTEGKAFRAALHGVNIASLAAYRARHPGDRVEIHVGWTDRAKREVGPPALKGRDADAHLVDVRDNVVFLVGNQPWSTAYACFGFLEDPCDVRWFLPGEFGEDVPRRPVLRVPVARTLSEPAFKHREMGVFSPGRPFNSQDETKRWMMHHRIQWPTRGLRVVRNAKPRFNYHHNLVNIFDPAKYAKTYPGLYPVLGGYRRIPAAGEHGWNPVLTHPKAVDITMDYARTFLKENPEICARLADAVYAAKGLKLRVPVGGPVPVAAVPDEAESAED